LGPGDAKQRMDHTVGDLKKVARGRRRAHSRMPNQNDEPSPTTPAHDWQTHGGGGREEGPTSSLFWPMGIESPRPWNPLNFFCKHFSSRPKLSFHLRLGCPLSPSFARFLYAPRPRRSPWFVGPTLKIREFIFFYPKPGQSVIFNSSLTREIEIVPCGSHFFLFALF